MAADDSLLGACFPKHVRVQGAGTDAVNGVYSLVGTYHERGLYHKQGLWENESRTFGLYRFKTRWYISVIPVGRLEPEERDDLDFYCAKETREDRQSATPPLSKWGTVQDESSLASTPCPTLTILPDAGLPEVTIAKQTASAYEKLLLSEKFSDVMLVCEDEVLPAHKNVLAVSSSYFNAAFTGPWNENEKGKLKIAYPSRVVKTFLKMFYTGVLDMSSITKEPIVFIAIASEFDLPWLKEVAKKTCSETIDKSNLKDTWQAARVYECATLKCRCVEYAKKNSLAVLAHGGISTLQAEDPSSWQEFANELEK